MPFVTADFIAALNDGDSHAEVRKKPRHVTLQSHAHPQPMYAGCLHVAVAALVVWFAFLASLPR